METIKIEIPKDKEVMQSVGNWLLKQAGEDVEAFVEDTAEAMEERIDNATSAATGSEIDIDGRPWDERIDSSAKSKTVDGRWKLKRGVDRDLADRIIAEYTVGAPVATTLEPEEPAATLATEAPAPPVPPAPATASVTTYTDLVHLISSRVNAGLLQPTEIEEACTAVGATAMGANSLPTLATHPEFIPLVADELKRRWATQG